MRCSSRKVQSSLFTAGAAIAVSAVLACGCMIPSGSAEAVTAAEKEAEAQQALTELNAMQETLDQASQRYYQSLADYEEAVEQRDAAEQRVEELNADIAEIQGRLGNRAREMYRNGATSFVDLLLGAASFEEFTLNWDLLNRVNETDADLSAKSRALRTEAEEQEVVLAEQQKVAQEKSEAASKAYQDAQDLVEQMQETYDSLSAEAQELYAQEQAAAAAAYATEGGVENDDGTVTDIATGQVYSSAAEYTAATGNAIVDRAMSMLGRGYRYGSTGSDGYFDCSGLVGYALTGTYDRIGSTGTYINWPTVDEPQPGDICVIHNGTSQHTGIYIGNGKMIHAQDENNGVVESPVQDGMSFHRYYG